MADQAQAQAPVDAASQDATLEGGSYEVIRRRLQAQGKTLAARAEGLNQRRIATFGSTELAVTAQGRVRTEHNCLPRDMVSLEGRLLLGYNVFLGLKRDVEVGDVLSLHLLARKDGEFEISPAPEVELDAFLKDPVFIRDFQELYRYYRDTRLVQLRRSDTELMAIFQMSERLDDTRIFRWSIAPDGSIKYVDCRGEYRFPPAFDFDWIRTTREMQVHGQHPHINILDTIFVETVGGDLTVKVENNTSDGMGIYREPVDDANQTLDDAEFYFAKLGALILLRIKPYREENYRHLVFNTRTQEVHRIDAIGQACVQLPEDHGIIFPGGYYLQTGEFKVFEGDKTGLRFKKLVKSPNGEDVLYVFYNRAGGEYALLPYNLIRKEVQSPLYCQGYSLFDDGFMLVLRSLTQEPTRVHPVQGWKTPFVSAEFAASAPTNGSLLAKIGNADLVRALSDILSVCRLIERPEPRRETFEDLINTSRKLVDTYYWLSQEEAGGVRGELNQVQKTAELVIDEFEKVVAFRKRAAQAIAEAETRHLEVTRELSPESMTQVEHFMAGLSALRGLRGQLITFREVKYINRPRLDELEKSAVERSEVISRACVAFLSDAKALAPLKGELTSLQGQIEATAKVAELSPLGQKAETLAQGLSVLTEVVANLQVDDVTVRTRILEDISEVFGQLNRVRAIYEGRRKQLLSVEGRAEFGAQFKLFGQSVASALALCDTPERCDAELARLMIQLQEIESRFSEFDDFLSDLAAKREETFEAFGGRKQTLVDERQRRVGNLEKAAARIFEGIARRTRAITSEDELNAFFASDAMIQKLRQLAEQLAALGDTVKSEDLLGRVKGARHDALRGLRDKLDLFTEGENLIKFGDFAFTVNTEPVELTLVPRGGEGGEALSLALHLTGTGFYEPVDDPGFEETRPFWSQTLVSETEQVYRAEYLAASILFQAERGEGLSVEVLLNDLRAEGQKLAERVRQIAQSRYDEGYERGLHDQDAALILEKLLGLRQGAGLLRFGPGPRAVGALFFGQLNLSDPQRLAWLKQAQSLGRLCRLMGPHPAQAALATALAQAISAFLVKEGLPELEVHVALAGAYLVEALAADSPRFTTSREAQDLVEALKRRLDAQRLSRALEEDLAGLGGAVKARLTLAQAWLEATARQEGLSLEPERVLEAAVLWAGPKVEREISSALTRVVVPGILGQHPRVQDRSLELRLDEFMARLSQFTQARVPGYLAYRKRRSALLEQARKRLRLDEFTPKVMSSFVRNRLINDVYLPLVGANLAKQMGAAGEKKRTDLMGLLLLISPPGYGKTTLMEYVANRLGLVFVKVNGPALGHEVKSLDPAEAPNATARQEVDKINFALEMGSNVMLYLDDIQHTHPELLQKFISLCDAQRKIEGIWRGQTHTYDMRGKKFCVVMAGNPYTESGTRFQIPDMLANRADTYNLGDILEGKEDVFALSYLENALTSNSVLQPLATRDQSDTYKLIRLAKGEEVPTNDLKYGYSNVELGEIISVFQRLMAIQRIVLKVNLMYIESAGQDDAYRVEPPFKLQGSYRNMNKMAEKVVAALNDEELEALIDGHYTGEAQTLTKGAEQNLLKLAELRGRMTSAQQERWDEIKRGFRRIQTLGGSGDDPASRVAASLAKLGEHLEVIRDNLGPKALSGLGERLSGIEAALQGQSTAAAIAGLGGKLDHLGQSVSKAGSSREALAPVVEQLAALKDAVGRGGGAASLAPVVQKLEALREALGPSVAVAAGALQNSEKLLGGLWTTLDGVRQAAAGESAIAQKLEAIRLAISAARPDAGRPAAPPLPGKWPASKSAPSASEGDLAAVLSELSRAIGQVSRPEVTVHVPPPPGVEELLAQQVAIVERTLVPLVRTTVEHLGNAQAIGDKVEELLRLLKSLSERLTPEGA